MEHDLGGLDDGVDDVLAVTRAEGCAKVHLRMRALGAEARTLCNMPTRLRPPARLFHQAGCAECARVAVAAGIDYVRERPQAWVNLRRAVGNTAV
jgi:hypothetical protein